MANFNEGRPIDLLGHLPPVLRDYREMRAIMEAERPEVEALWSAVEDCFDDQFIATATKQGIVRREAELDIVPFATDTLEDRRFRVLARYNESIPYTRVRLRQLLDGLCGPDGYEVRFLTGDFTVDVKVDLGVKKQFQVVEELLERQLPYNMAFKVTLKYNTHRILSGYTHRELSQYTHGQLRNEVLR